MCGSVILVLHSLHVVFEIWTMYPILIPFNAGLFCLKHFLAPCIARIVGLCSSGQSTFNHLYE